MVGFIVRWKKRTPELLLWCTFTIPETRYSTGNLDNSIALLTLHTFTMCVQVSAAINEQLDSICVSWSQIKFVKLQVQPQQPVYPI